MPTASRKQDERDLRILKLHDVGRTSAQIARTMKITARLARDVVARVTKAYERSLK